MPLFALSAEPRIARDDSRMVVDLSGHVQLVFAMDGEYLLGLNRATVAGIALKSPETVMRPLLAQEYGDKAAWPFMRFVDSSIVDGAVHIDVELLGVPGHDRLRDEFVFIADYEAAAGPGMPPDLRRLRDAADLARADLETRTADDAALMALRKALAECEAEDARNGTATPGRRTRGARDELRRAERKRWTELAEADGEIEAKRTVLSAYEDALHQRAMEIGKIHRDAYEFAHVRLPAESCRAAALRERLAAQRADLVPGGRLTWVLEPVTRTIAGWPWRGWKQSYRFSLEKPHKVNCLRQVGTWELGGEAVGLTVVNMRYRGLGGIEETLAAGPSGGVARAWTTTEIMPGAAGKAPLVSPVVPAAADPSLTDRGYTLAHRLGAWISKTARGAGCGFVDFQSKAGAVLIGYRERQGDQRALTEVFPGDTMLSQTDEEWFANTSTHASEPQLYLLLHDPARPFALNEIRTRWQEVDQYVRDLVAGDLGFVQCEPLPGVGFLNEQGRAGYLESLADGALERWYGQGVRMLVTHAPGWWTDQHRNGPDKPQIGGNSNRVWDWVPTDDVKPGWRGMMQVCAKLGVPYFIYMTGMSNPDGPFVQAVGADARNWGMNAPAAGFSSGYPPLRGHNLHNEAMRELLRNRIRALQADYGFQGFWADSFQNMYMSQLNWGDGSGAPMQRLWWEQVAEWSRTGLYWMAESQAFPGLSCSIEVSGWEDACYYLPYVWKWLRGTSQGQYGPEELDRMAFRFMANKAWLAPDRSYAAGGPLVIPEFTRLSAEYMAALPSMRRPWVLADDAGVVWRPFDSETEAVWFSFKEQAVPPGVDVSYILDGTATKRAAVQRTYRVKGAALAEAFGIRTPPSADERAGRPWKPAPFLFPAWASDSGRGS